MPRTLHEITSELLAHADQGEVSSWLENEGHATIKNFRASQFAAGKSQGDKGLKELKKKAEKAESLDDILGLAREIGVPEERVTEVKTAVPDRAALENEIKGKYDGKLSERDTTIGKQKEKLQSNGRSLAWKRINAMLTATGPEKDRLLKQHKGLALGDVNPEYAEEVLFRKYGAHIVVDDEGNPTDVLKPGEQTGFQAGSLDEKLVLFADAIRKTVPSTFIMVAGERGGNVRGDAGAQGSRTPVTKAVEEKSTKPEYQAF